MDKILGQLKKLGIITLKNEELKKHTTLRIGGPAKYFAYIQNQHQLKEILKILNSENQNYFVIGAGSNLLVSDKGFDGWVLKLKGDFLNIHHQNEKVYSGAAVMLNMLIKYCIDNSLSGLEELFGIPGTVGGAIWMNAGTKNKEISQCLEYIEIVDGKNYEIIKLKKNDINFSYRNSGLKDCVIIGASFNLFNDDKKMLEQKINHILLERAKSQPLGNFNAGCVFKNPKNCNFTAGMLIEKCGLKGFTIGDSCVSEKHANFIINKNNATSKEFVEVMKHVMSSVKEKFNIELEPEIKLINIKL